MRYAETADAPVAIVVSEGDTIAYWFASEAFEESGVEWIRKGTPLPETATRALNRKPDGVAGGEHVEASTNLREWFSDGRIASSPKMLLGLAATARRLRCCSPRTGRTKRTKTLRISVNGTRHSDDRGGDRTGVLCA